jgi:hypothetical protein
MQASIKLAVRKSPTGLYWWVIDEANPMKPLAVRDTQWEAEDKLDDLQRIANYMAA